MIPIKDIVKQAGGPVAIARRIERSSAAVSQWKRVPIDHVRAVAELSGIAVERLRPDVFEAVKIAPTAEQAELATGGALKASKPALRVSSA